MNKSEFYQSWRSQFGSLPHYAPMLFHQAPEERVLRISALEAGKTYESYYLKMKKIRDTQNELITKLLGKKTALVLVYQGYFSRPDIAKSFGKESLSPLDDVLLHDISDAPFNPNDYIPASFVPLVWAKDQFDNLLMHGTESAKILLFSSLLGRAFSPTSEGLDILFESAEAQQQFRQEWDSR